MNPKSPAPPGVSERHEAEGAAIKGVAQERFYLSLFGSMRDQSFTPLAVETEKAGQYRIVRTLTEAADMLLNRWPEQKGQKHRKALSAIMDAMEGRKPAVTARKAVIAATKEAGIFVRDPA